VELHRAVQGIKWGRQIAAAALQRPLFGGYPIQKWL
jgi:hypothetical protein